MRIVIRESDRKTAGGEEVQDAVVYRLGQDEGVQLTVLTEGDHVTVRIQGGVADGSAPPKRSNGTSSRHVGGSRRNRHARRARIAGY